MRTYFSFEIFNWHLFDAFKRERKSSLNRAKPIRSFANEVEVHFRVNDCEQIIWAEVWNVSGLVIAKQLTSGQTKQMTQGVRWLGTLTKICGIKLMGGPFGWSLPLPTEMYLNNNFLSSPALLQ